MSDGPSSSGRNDDVAALPRPPAEAGIQTRVNANVEMLLISLPSVVDLLNKDVEVYYTKGRDAHAAGPFLVRKVACKSASGTLTFIALVAEGGYAEDLRRLANSRSVKFYVMPKEGK